MVHKDLHETKIKIRKQTLDFSFRNLSLALGIQSKERFDAVKEDLNKLLNLHQQVIFDTGYFPTKQRKALAEMGADKKPIIQPKKLFETFIQSYAEEGKAPMLNDLLNLISGPNS